MNKEQFIDTLRRALYGKIDDYTLQDHIRYYEDYIRQEMGKGRTEQEVLQELGDPRLLARTIVETSSLKNPDTVYTVDEEGQNSYGTSEDRVKVHTFTGMEGNPSDGSGRGSDHFICCCYPWTGILSVADHSRSRGSDMVVPVADRIWKILTG